MSAFESNPIDHRSASLLGRLLDRYGEVLDTPALMALLKFHSNRGFRRTVAKGALPVAVFHIPGKKGWFARTEDVASWLAKAGSTAPQTDNSEEKPMA